MSTAVDRNASHNPLDAVEVPHPMSKRWIPLKHSNGIVVYYHQNVTEAADFIGGEYMMSSIVKGTPEQCLAALTHRSSTITILGPASAADVLRTDCNSQVLLLQLAPPAGSGLCSSLCAPRQAVVKQVLTKDPSGIHCLMFSSIPHREAQLLLQQQQRRHQRPPPHHHHIHQQQHQQPPQQQWRRYSCTDEQQHHHHQQQQYRQGIGFLQQHLTSCLGFCAAAAVKTCKKLDSWLGGSGSSRRWGLGEKLWQPVLVNVAGGYTVSALHGFETEASLETLVTCILKVDLGGWISAQHPGGWLHQPALRLGIIDQMTEWMLTSVMLVKDEVEQQRCRSYPCATLQHAAVIQALNPNAVTPAQTLNGACCALLQSTTAAAAAAVAPPGSKGFTSQQQQRSRLSADGTSSGSDLARNLVCSIQGLLLSLIGMASWILGLSTEKSSSCSRLSRVLSSKQSQDCQLDLSFRVVETQDHTAEEAGLSSGSDDVGGLKPEAAAAAAAAGSVSDQLVGLDDNGQPLRGFCNQAFWSELHTPGHPSMFKVRGQSYLADGAKVAAGQPAYTLLAVDLVSTPTAVQHLARYLPSVRRSRAASCFVVNMMVPDAHTVLNLVMTFGSARHWNHLSKGSAASDGSSGSSGGAVVVDGCTGGSSNDMGNGSSSSSGAGSSSSDGSSSSESSETCEWTGFDHVLHRFICGSDEERSSIFKMIPHIEVGSWLIKQLVGTTPVIMGRKLATTYHLTDKYIEVDIDVTTCKTAGYIVSSIRGVTTSMLIDLSYLLEGQRPCELPEVLLGAVRFCNIDMAATTPLDMSREIPMWPEPWK